MLSTLARPTIVFVIPETVPVNVGEAIGAFVAIELVTVVEKLASFPKAAANSFNVSSVAGDEATKLDIPVLTALSAYVLVAIVLSTDIAPVVSLYDNPVPRLFPIASCAFSSL